jgi:hypothetical protein
MEINFEMKVTRDHNDILGEGASSLEMFDGAVENRNVRQYSKQSILVLMRLAMVRN